MLKNFVLVKFYADLINRMKEKILEGKYFRHNFNWVNK